MRNGFGSDEFNSLAGLSGYWPYPKKNPTAREQLIAALANLSPQTGDGYSIGTGRFAFSRASSAPAPGAREPESEPFELRSRTNGDMQPAVPAFDSGNRDPERAPGAGNADQDGYALSFAAGDMASGAGPMANQAGPGLTRVQQQQRPQDPYCNKKRYPNRGHPNAGKKRPIPLPGAGTRGFKGPDAQLKMARAVRSAIFKETWFNPRHPIEVGVRFYSMIDEREDNKYKKMEDKQTFFYTDAVTQHLFGDVRLDQELPMGANPAGDVHSHVTLSCTSTPGGNPRTSHRDRPSTSSRKNFVIAGRSGDLYQVMPGGSYIRR